VFQGYDTSANWVTLDERHYPYRAPRSYSESLYFVDCSDYFSLFRLMVTQGADFSLSAFEIFGWIAAKEENQPSDVTYNTGDEPFDPWDLPDLD
jgi:hypothetical protein